MNYDYDKDLIKNSLDIAHKETETKQKLIKKIFEINEFNKNENFVN